MRSLLNNLSTREKRAVALLALSTLLFLLADYVVFPLMDTADSQHSSLGMKEKSLRKYRRLAAMVGPAETDWNAAQQRLAQAERGLLDNRVPALASAELQERIKEVLKQQAIEPQGMSFMAVQAVSPAETGYLAVPVAVSFECNVDQLLGVMTALQSGAKTITVDQLNVAGTASRTDKPKQLAVRLVVRALMLPAEAAGKS